LLGTGRTEFLAIVFINCLFFRYSADSSFISAPVYNFSPLGKSLETLHADNSRQKSI